MKKKFPVPAFKDFLKKFPQLDPPISLSSDDHLAFSRENKPLSESLINTYIRPFEKEDADEFTEYVPCFRLPATPAYEAVVYWRAKLMDYHYTMLTFTPKGEHIQSLHIAGLRTDGEKIAQLVCHIKENRTIHLVAGSNRVDERNYDPKTSKAFIITLLEDGSSDIEMDENLIE